MEMDMSAFECYLLNYTKVEMVHVLNISKPSIVFCSADVLRVFSELKRELNFIRKIIVINGNPSDREAVPIANFFINYDEINVPEFQITEVDPPNHVAFIMPSSGTTGLAKGVMLTHENILMTFLHSDDQETQQPRRSTLGLLPFFHVYGMFRTLNHLVENVKIIVMKKFDEELFLSTIEKYKITSLPLVPPLAAFLAKSPLVDKYDLSSIKEATCGAAPLNKRVEELLKSRLKIKSVQQAYGLTETTLRVMSIPSGVEKFGSSGKLVAYMSCKVRDPETGRSLGANQVGELCLKGPLVMKGYYNNEEATRSCFSDGWLLTGDIGYYDEEHYFYIVDRLKEIIKYKAFQVAPAELEAILLTNPKIKDAGVVGLPDEEAGELPLAFVVADGRITEEEIKNFIAERVSSPKRLRGGVIFVPEIPKNPSGKILRRKLRELLVKYKSKL